MRRVKYSIKNYYFEMPKISENDYNVLKQNLKINPNYKVNFNDTFWKEFEFTKWVLILIVICILFVEKFEFLGTVLILLFGYLMISLIMGEGESMMNYRIFSYNRKIFYKKLLKDISESNNYIDFYSKYKKYNF